MYDLCELLKSGLFLTLIESYFPFPLLSRGKRVLAYCLKHIEVGLALDCTPILITLITTKDTSKPLDLVLIGKELAMCVHIRTNDEQPVFSCHDIPLLSL